MNYVPPEEVPLKNYEFQPKNDMAQPIDQK